MDCWEPVRTRVADPLFDPRPAKREVGVVGWQPPNAMHVVRQNHPRHDLKGLLLAGGANCGVQSVQATRIGQDRLTAEGVDREKICCAPNIGSTIVRHHRMVSRNGAQAHPTLLPGTAKWCASAPYAGSIKRVSKSPKALQQRPRYRSYPLQNRRATRFPPVAYRRSRLAGAGSGVRS